MSTLDKVRSLLAQITTPGSFATRRTVAPGDLRLGVKGVGRIRLPVTATQALERCAVGHPARHGYKDQTRLDRRVRDTWEILLIVPRRAPGARRPLQQPLPGIHRRHPLAWLDWRRQPSAYPSGVS